MRIEPSGAETSSYTGQRPAASASSTSIPVVRSPSSSSCRCCRSPTGPSLPGSPVARRPSTSATIDRPFPPTMRGRPARRPTADPDRRLARHRLPGSARDWRPGPGSTGSPPRQARHPNGATGRTPSPAAGRCACSTRSGDRSPASRSPSRPASDVRRASPTRSARSRACPCAGRTELASTDGDRRRCR